MKRWMLVASLAATAWLASACTEPAEPGALPDVAAAAKTVSGDPEAKPEEIRVERVRSVALRASIAASGTIEARRLTEVAAEVPGRIVHVHVDVGDDVDEGAPLFQIDPEPYRLIVAEARAARELARAESANADAEAERVHALVAESFASEQRWDQLRTVAEVAQARVAAAQARLDRAQRDLVRTEVRAPYHASVVERRAHEGTMAATSPILVLQERGALEAILDVPEATPVAVRVGDPLRLYVEGVIDPIPARVDRVAGRIDPQTRTYEVRADVSDAGGLVKAGSYARAEIEPTRPTPQPVVSADSLLNRDGRSYVLRVEDGVVHHVPVRVGIQVGDDAEILSGVEAGEWIVAGEAVVRLAEGTKVRGIAEELSSAATAAANPGAEEPGT